MATKKRSLDQLKADNKDVADTSNIDKKAKVSKDDEKKNEDYTKVPGDEDLKYKVGSCCDLLFHRLIARLIGDSDKAEKQKMIETLYEFDVVLEFFSLVVNVCMADGKLGENETNFIRRSAEFWQMPDPQLDEALLGKDLSSEFVVNIQKYWNKVCPGLSDAQMILRCNALKDNVITYAILAATQDGLVQKEYEGAKKMAKKLGLKEESVKDNIEIVKAEKELAEKIKAKFLRNKK